MSEEIRNNEISEKEMEKVSGGTEIHELPEGWQEGITLTGAIEVD